MKTFVLQGASNTGKSTSIQQLFNLLSQDDFFTKVDRSKHFRSIDFYACFSYISKNDGKKKILGLSSFGDNFESMKNSFDYFNEKNCDIVLTACRMSGQTIDFLKEYLSEYKLIKINDLKYFDGIETNYQTNIISQRLKGRIVSNLP